MGAAGFRFIIGAAVMAVSCTSIAADTRTFDGTVWRIAAINGETTPSNAYYVSFDRGAVGGRVGCNDFGGRFSVEAADLNVRALRATSRICGDTAATFEGGLFVVLSQPMRMDWASAQRLTLANGNGPIALERLP